MFTRVLVFAALLLSGAIFCDRCNRESPPSHPSYYFYRYLSAKFSAREHDVKEIGTENTVRAGGFDDVSAASLFTLCARVQIEKTCFECGKQALSYCHGCNAAHCHVCSVFTLFVLAGML